MRGTSSLKPVSGGLRIAGAIAVGVLLFATAATSSHAATGDYTATFDWDGAKTASFQGWDLGGDVAPSAEACMAATQPPPASKYFGGRKQDSGATGRAGDGLSLYPIGEVSPVETRAMYNCAGDTDSGVPSRAFTLTMPAENDSVIRSAKLEHVSWVNNGDGQVFRARVLDKDGIPQGDAFNTAPNDPPPAPQWDTGVYANDTSWGPVGGASVNGRKVELSLRLWCIQTGMRGSCPLTVETGGLAEDRAMFPGQPRSGVRVGKVELGLNDSANPAIATDGNVPGAWTKKPGKKRIFKIQATDTGSGLKLLKIELIRNKKLVAPPVKTYTEADNGGCKVLTCPNKLPALPYELNVKPSTGVTSYKITAKDASNRDSTSILNFRIDQDKPSARASAIDRRDPTKPVSFDERWISRTDPLKLKIGLSASDKTSGVAGAELVRKRGKSVVETVVSDAICPQRIPYNSEGKCPIMPTGLDKAVDVSTWADGKYTLAATATDVAGNKSPAAKDPVDIWIDRTPPLMPVPVRRGLTVDGKKITLKWKRSSDKTSGVHKYRFRVLLRQKPVTSWEATSALQATVDLSKVRIPRGQDLRDEDVRAEIQAIDDAGNESALQRVPTRRAYKPGRKKVKPTYRPKPFKKARQPVEYGLSEPNFHQIGGNQAFDKLFLDYRNSPNYKQSKAAVDKSRVKWLRLVMPFDLHPSLTVDKRPTPADDFGIRAKRQLDAFVDKLKQNPDMKGLISFMGNRSFSWDCTEPLPPPAKPGPNTVRPVEYTEAIRTYPGAECEYPEPGTAYQKYFQEWLDWNASIGNKVQAWAPWNEADLKGFVFGALDANEMVPIVASYWQTANATMQADAKLPGRKPSTVLAGEMSKYVVRERTKDGRINQAMVEGYIDQVLKGPGKPTDWSIHAYDDLLPGKERTFSIVNLRTRLHQKAHSGSVTRDFKPWVTEIGAKLGGSKRGGTGSVPKPTVLHNRPQLQLLAGLDFADLQRNMAELRTVIYYNLRGAQPGLNFDSGMADDKGNPLATYCGVIGKSLNKQKKCLIK